MTVTVRRATPDDLDSVFGIRSEVFTAGLGVPPDIERDDADATAIHVIAERGR
ncbi:MAG: hypothetical protein WCB04_14630 [Mycobacteriales bacterium]